jgi:hypothetical protein
LQATAQLPVPTPFTHISQQHGVFAGASLQGSSCKSVNEAVICHKLLHMTCETTCVAVQQYQACVILLLLLLLLLLLFCPLRLLHPAAFEQQPSRAAEDAPHAIALALPAMPCMLMPHTM